MHDPQTDAADPRDASANALSPRTTPTWEMELLVSGATILGLLQLPALFDHAYFRTLNLSPGEYVQILNAIWMYSKLGVLILAITFVMHLCLRGYWVALVGLDSVYREGIRWDRLGMGPLARATVRKAAPSTAALIERADNRATRVFAMGFAIAMVMLVLVSVVLVGLGLSLAVDVIAGPGHAQAVMGVFALVVLVPWSVARVIDRRFAGRIHPEGFAGRTLVSVLGTSARLGLGRGSNPLVALFVSHEGRSRVGAAVLALMLPVMAVLLAQSTLARGRLPFGFSAGLSVGRPGAEDSSPSAFYAASGMSREVEIPWPHIPSRVAGGPYVELFVPFLPRMHAPALETACPQALAGAEANSDHARLACLARLLDIRLDGQPLSLALDASNDPETGQPGVLAMVPVAILAPGRHELSLARAESFRGGRWAGTRYRIPFWK